MDDSFYVKNLEKVLSSFRSGCINPPWKDRSKKDRGKMRRVAIARLLLDVGAFRSDCDGRPMSWNSFLFAVELFHQNSFSHLSGALKTLDLYYKVKERIPEHVDMMGVPSFSFSWEDSYDAYVCYLLFNGDTEFIVRGWFSHDPELDMGHDKLRQKILNKVVI